MKFTKFSFIILSLLVIQCIATKNKSAQYQALERYCYGQLCNCLKNQACIQDFNFCKSKLQDIDIIDCLKQSKSYLTNYIISCYDSLGGGNKYEGVLKKYCSNEYFRCQQDKICSQNLDKCQQEQDEIQCLSKSNSIYTNQMVQCYDQNKD